MEFVLTQTEQQIVGAVMILISAVSAVGWIRDLRFYKQNNWDFSIESGRTYIGTGVAFGTPMKPRQRVFVGFPSVILISLILGLAFVFSDPHP